MSEQEQEQVEQVPPGVDPETGEVLDGDPVEPEAPEQEPAAEQPAEQSSASEDQLAAYRQLDVKADNYFKACVKIINEAELPLVMCELSADAYPGFRWAEPQNDQARAMLSVIGAAGGESPLESDPDAQLCERCNGFGWTKLPSHVPGNTERVCRRCNGAGWLDTNPQSGAPVPPTPVAVNGDHEDMPGIPENDPSVVDLRARGFTIIPPMKIGAAGE